jgi:CRP-like cAMP-binding protein
VTKVTPAALTALGAIPYLAALPDAERLTLARRCRLRSVPKGGVIFEEGQPPAGLFVILAGRVRLVRASVGGREQVLHAEGAGATLAEVPVFDGAGYVASAFAMEPCRIMMIPRAAVLDACRRHPAVALGVIHTLAHRVRTFAGLIETLALRDVTARVARFLVDEAHRAATNEFSLPGTREDIGARLGTVRELVTRSLSRLQAAGVIERANRRIRVRDLAGLTRFADAGP